LNECDIEARRRFDSCDGRVAASAGLRRAFLGWPPLAEALTKATANKIQIYACGACSRARGVTEADLSQWGAKFGNPTIFISLVEWADRIITE